MPSYLGSRGHWSKKAKPRHAVQVSQAATVDESPGSQGRDPTVPRLECRSRLPSASRGPGAKALRVELVNIAQLSESSIV